MDEITGHELLHHMVAMFIGMMEIQSQGRLDFTKTTEISHI